MSTLNQETQEILNKVLTGIAQKNFPTIQTLETRGSDSLDFHDVSVRSIHDALKDAFIAGMTCGHSLSVDMTL